MIMAMVDGVEITIDPLDANTWHTPKNQREYLRSPQRAQWRTAKEKKMDQYQQLKVFKLHLYLLSLRVRTCRRARRVYTAHSPTYAR